MGDGETGRIATAERLATLETLINIQAEELRELKDANRNIWKSIWRISLRVYWMSGASAALAFAASYILNGV